MIEEKWDTYKWTFHITSSQNNINYKNKKKRL